MTNKEMKMARYSEWTDLFHVVVPVSYCDVVMIDKRWKAFIMQTCFSHPQIAKVFDKKSLDEFFQTIETWKDTIPNHGGEPSGVYRQVPGETRGDGSAAGVS
jgi:hypothetical protein